MQVMDVLFSAGRYIHAAAVPLSAKEGNPVIHTESRSWMTYCASSV